MVTASGLQQQRWHDDEGRQLIVTCGDTGCLTEITVPGNRRSKMTAEVLIQPRNDRGLPTGPVVVLCQTDVDLVPLPGWKRLVGRFWLPQGIRWQSAVNCYFRLAGMRDTKPLESK